MSSLEKYLFRSFTHLKIGRLLLLFLLFICKSSLYILDNILLPDKWSANIFFHSIGFLYIFWIVLFALQNFFSLM